MNVMSFNNIAIIVIAIFFYFPLNKKFKPYYLLLLSLGLYCWHNPKNIAFILLTSLTTYFAAKYFEKLDNNFDLAIAERPAERKQLRLENTAKKKKILTLILIVNFSALFFFKYINMIITNINQLFMQKNIDFLELTLPLGISFYTFQAMGYLIDIYRKKYQAEKSFFHMLLFLSYFPQVIQGPISRYDHLMPQLLADNKFDYDRTVKAGIVITWGYFKKIAIAEGLAILVNEILENPETYYGLYIPYAIFLYSIQIYCDFSGGINIISGLSELVGVRLDKNFERPFFAKSLSDFWRRWHITLGSWMRDYVFYPIAFSPKFGKFNRRLKRTKRKKLAKILPSAVASMIVFLLVGMWHGSSLKYVAFGLYNGTIITASLLLEDQYIKWKKFFKINSAGIGWRLFQIMRTLVICTIGRYFTRGTSFLNAISLYQLSVSYFNPFIFINGSLAKINLNEQQLSVLFIAILILFAVELLQERGYEVRETLLKSHMVFRSIVLASLILFILIFGFYGKKAVSTNFIYQGF